MLIRRKTRKQMIGFVLTGLLSTLIMYACYLLFYQFFSYQYAYFFSYFISIIALYFMNVRVFNRYIALHSFIKFPLVYAIQYLIGAAGLELLVDVGIPKIFAPVLVVILLFPVTFILNKLIFKS
ncbi:GtrA family protein [Legionella sp. km772]|uniref:GtrA family protein n=1 Tax=Legionella sp. km772 TaxID=2498111 RepID=UPI000F8CBEAA|nr:GtrA family protein [Legionella sp. km772]RUR13180.1 GtrA family protein [Legionella sp. km772]